MFKIKKKKNKKKQKKTKKQNKTKKNKKTKTKRKQNKQTNIALKDQVVYVQLFHGVNIPLSLLPIPHTLLFTKYIKWLKIKHRVESSCRHTVKSSII